MPQPPTPPPPPDPAGFARRQRLHAAWLALHLADRIDDSATPEPLRERLRAAVERLRREAEGAPVAPAPRYELVRHPGTRDAGIRCATCGLTSYNPNDVAHRYCGFCHVAHDDYT